MRLLHLTQDLAFGGAQKQLSYLAPELARMGLEVHVAFIDGGPNLARLESSGVILHHIGRGDPRLARGRGLHNYDPTVLPRLTGLIRKIRPDVVQTWIQYMDILGGLACGFTQTPWILCEPGSATAYPPRSPKTVARILMGKTASKIVVLSEEGERSWAIQAPKVPRIVIRCGLPLEEMEATPAVDPVETGVPASEKILLFAGRFHPCKNLSNLVPAMASVLKHTPGTKASLCGAGPESEKIRRMIDESGCADRFILPGVVPSVWAWMKSAAVFVSVSHYEGCPNTVLEAMATGCPVVVSDIPAHRELLNEDSAWFADPNDPSQIAATLQTVLSRPDEARRRARRARELVEPLSLGSMARQYEEVYRIAYHRALRLPRAS